MVLRDPRGIKTQLLGMNDLLGRQPVALLCAGVVQKAGKKSKTFTAHNFPLRRRDGGREWHQSAGGCNRWMAAQILLPLRRNPPVARGLTPRRCGRFAGRSPDSAR